MAEMEADGEDPSSRFNRGKLRRNRWHPCHGWVSPVLLGCGSK